MRSARILRSVSALLMLGSPWVLYWSLTHGSSALAGGILIAWLAVRALPAWLTAEPALRRATLVLPAVGMTFAAVGIALESGFMFRLVPSLTNFAFSATFVASLRKTPLVEHFARLTKPDLHDEEVQYCRTLTKVWAAYLVAIGTVGVALAAWAPIAIWAAYSGGVAYALVGLLAAVEYLFRKLWFRGLDLPSTGGVLHRLPPDP